MPSVRANITRWVTKNFVRPWLSAGPWQANRKKFAALAPRRLPAKFRFEQVAIPRPDGTTVPGEWALAKDADPACEHVIYYVHGGAFIGCSPATHRALVSKLAKGAGARALQLDYRLAPEHPFPAALEDTLAGWHYLLASGVRPENVIVAGDSAGGALILGLLLMLRDLGEALPGAGVCLSPATNVVESGASFVTRLRDEAFLTEKLCQTAIALYVPDEQQRSARYVSPLRESLHGLPPLLIHVGTHELLLDDSISFAEKAQLAGVDVTLKVWEGMWHVFHAFMGVPEADQANREISEFMRARFGGTATKAPSGRTSGASAESDQLSPPSA